MEAEAEGTKNFPTSVFYGCVSASKFFLREFERDAVEICGKSACAPLWLWGESWENFGTPIQHQQTRLDQGYRRGTFWVARASVRRECQSASDDAFDIWKSFPIE